MQKKKPLANSNNETSAIEETIRNQIKRLDDWDATAGGAAYMLRMLESYEEAAAFLDGVAATSRMTAKALRSSIGDDEIPF